MVRIMYSAAALANSPTGGVDVFRTQPAEHLIDGQVDTLQFGLVDQYVNLLL